MNLRENDLTIEDLLKSLDPNNLTLEQKFILLMLKNHEFYCFPELKKKKYEALKEIRDDFKKDLVSYRKELISVKDKILDNLNQLYDLEFIADSASNRQLVNAIKSEIHKIDYDSPDQAIKNIEDPLDKLSNLTPENYMTAKGISEIATLQKKYQLDYAFNIQPIAIPIDESKKIVEQETQKQRLIFNIKDELCSYKYALSYHFNEEVLFTAAFIDPDILETGAPELFKIYKKRRKLYKEIDQKIKQHSKYNIIQFTHLFLSLSQVDDFSLLYFRLRKLIHVYFFLFKAKPELIELYPKIESHLNTVLVISSETDLLYPEINHMYGSNFSKLLDQLGITQKDIANILGISTSALSQSINSTASSSKDGTASSKTSKPNFKHLSKISQLYTCSLSFLQEKTTIPYYGKTTTDKSALYLLHVVAKRNIGISFLGIMKEIFTQNREATYKLYKIDPSLAPNTPEEKERFDAVAKHIAFLEKKYKNISLAKINSLKTLLD